jgi:hypothetical protein
MLALLAAPGLVKAEPPEPPEQGWHVEAPSALAVPPDDLSWDRRFTLAGLNGPVKSIVMASGGIYAAGAFDVAGNNPEVHNIAFWNGSSWLPLGAGLDGDQVNALLLDGAGNLYVAGDFSKAGPVYVDNLAIYSTLTQSWAALPGFPTDPNEPIYSLALDSIHNVLFAGSSRRVVRYDLTSHAVTSWSTGVNKNVYALAYEPASQILYAGGDIPSINGVSVKNVAQFNGTIWQPVGAAVFNNKIYTLSLDENGHLFVGGSFTSPSKSVMYWNGSVWASLSTGLPIGSADSLTYDAANRILYSGGTGGVYAWNIGLGTWAQVGDAYTGNDRVTSMQLYGGNLYIGGHFTRIGELPITTVAYWNGSTWQAVDAAPGLGIVSPTGVSSMLSEPGGSVIVSGEFNRAGSSLNLSNIARFDGTSWQALGGGVDGPAFSLLSDGGKIYAGGAFSNVGGNWDAVLKTFVGRTSVKNIASWDGANWAALGGGLNDRVISLASNGSGVIYAGGAFDQAGGLPASHVAKWDGAGWSALTEGVSDGVNGDVYKVAVDTAGNVYVGGCFSKAAGKSMNALAVYRASDHTWQALGSFAASDCVYELEYHALSQSLLVGGRFANAGGQPANSFAIYNIKGDYWTVLGAVPGVTNSSGDPAGVNNIEVDNIGRIYISGKFDRAGGKEIKDTARWGGTWESLGSGLDTLISTMSFNPTGVVYFGGRFTKAGLYPSARIAAYQGGLGGVMLKSPQDGQIFTEIPRSLPLTWQPYPGAKGYEIQLLGYNDYSQVKTFKSKKPVLALSKKYIQPIDGPYFWRVRAMNGKTPLSGWSGVYEFRMPYRALQLVSPAPGAKLVDRQPVFIWEAARYPDTIALYEFELYSDARMRNRIWQAVVEKGEVYYCPFVLRPNTAYYWRVRFMAPNKQVSLWPKLAKFTTLK